MIAYRIAWREYETGATGHGEYCLTMDQAVAWIADLEKRHPNMKHWIESN
jgi:hypothetical protein